MRTFFLSLLLAAIASAAVIPTPVPNNTVSGISVGAGWVEATNHHVVRTSADVVYIVASDDSPCLTSGSGVIRVYKGSGANSTNPLVPTSFAEVDAAHHPVSPNSGGCQFSAGSVNLLFAPDVRLDVSGIIHIAYIDPASNNNGSVYYQTFSTATNLWGSRTQVATGAETSVGGSWPRGSHCALTLDANGVPYIVWATGGASNAIQWAAKTASGGTAFTTAATISGSSGTNEFQPSIVSAIDGSIHLAWIDNALAAHSVIKYARFFGGSWGAVETVSTGDSNVLGDGDHDQMPSVVTDASSRPFVLYNDGTVSGNDNYIRQRFRTAANTWVDDTAPGTSGASSASGTWFNHTSQNYISAIGDVYIFLGHDVNVSPGPFAYQVGGPGNNWSAVTQLDPCNTTTVTAGEAGCDGSMSIRFDPIRPGRTNIIDLVYYDENDGTVAGNHHGTIFYKAVDIGDVANIWVATTGNDTTCTRSASIVTFDATKACLSISKAWTLAVGGDQIKAKAGIYPSAVNASGTKTSTVTISSAIGEDAWFPGDGSISGASNMVIQDERNVMTQGFVMDQEVVSGGSSNITFTNVDMWCRDVPAEGWHMTTGTGGTECSSRILVGDTIGFLMTGGFVGPFTDCDGSVDSLCNNAGDGNKITSCTNNTTCTNITFDGTVFHDTRSESTAFGQQHLENMKIDQGTNILFKHVKFLACPDCGSANVFFGQSGTKDTADFVTFEDDTFGATPGKGINYGFNAPSGRATHLTFNYNSVNGTISVGDAATVGTLPGTNVSYTGNTAFRQAFQGCSTGTFSKDTWWTSSGTTTASCTGDNAGLVDSAAVKWVNAAADDYHLQAASPLLSAGGASCSGLTDVYGVSRPQGTCDVGAAEFVSVTSTPAPAVGFFADLMEIK